MVTPADQLTPKPAWYKKDDVADIERTMLPEWFDSSASHRTPESYIKAREKVIAISETIANRNVTNSMIRRSIFGDAGSLQRLRSFLVNFGLVNEDGINDSAPTPAILREQTSAPKRFNDQLRDELVVAVVHQSKRRKIDDADKSESSFVPIDWEEVAMEVGHGATSADCEMNFLSMPLNEGNAMSTERSITPDVSHDANKVASSAADEVKELKETSSESQISKEILRQEVIRDLIDNSSPDIIRTVTEAAMEAADKNLKQAQSAAVLGLVAARAVEKARMHENDLSSVLSQLVNQRMEKLENRMALIDDIEGIMEAEKIALELERRDLYTARCRHWFGGA
jgi:SWI/SNF related-matrix-associated actin-dependent regulator of chromatin subfamily C